MLVWWNQAKCHLKIFKTTSLENWRACVHVNIFEREKQILRVIHNIRADSSLAPSQWETSLQSNIVSHWLGANLEWALQYHDDDHVSVILQGQLNDLLIEVAYPLCAIFQLYDGTLYENTETIERIESGKAFSDWGGDLVAGSRAEGLAMEQNWGHPPPDEDKMVVLGGPFGVTVQTHQSIHGQASFIYHSEGCPPAYCKLEIRNPSWLREQPWWDESCIHKDGGRLWLDTSMTVPCMAPGNIAGPAGQDGLTEYVHTLVGSHPHPNLNEEMHPKRQGKWPPSHVINYILRLPMLMVLVGNKTSPDFKQQARLSWSPAEIKLMNELSITIRQGYIASKYVLKQFLAIHRGEKSNGDGRSCVGSFHIKTTFLHLLHKHPPSTIKSPFTLFIDLLKELDNYLKLGKLPHYFLSRCDLFARVDDDERRIARRAIKAILSDPLTAILASPTASYEIYGDVHPNELMTAFRGVYTNPTCERRWGRLCQLLSDVDENRKQRHCHLREVSGRPGLVELVEALQDLKTHCMK